MEITDKQRIEFCDTYLMSVKLHSPKSNEEELSYEITYLSKESVCTVISDTFTKTIDMAIKLMEK